MDSIDYILLLVIVACLVTLIYIRKKRSLEEEIDALSVEPSGEKDGASEDRCTTEKGNHEPGPVQNMIYEFTSEKKGRVCPFCDGENAPGSKVCCICGRDIY